MADNRPVLNKLSIKNSKIVFVQLIFTILFLQLYSVGGSEYSQAFEIIQNAINREKGVYQNADQLFLKSDYIYSDLSDVNPVIEYHQGFESESAFRITNLTNTVFSQNHFNKAIFEERASVNHQINRDHDLDYSQGGDNWNVGIGLTGQNQSPINIQINDLGDLKTYYINITMNNITNGEIFHEHDKLFVEYTDGMLMYKIQDQVNIWNSFTFDFHAPSEHMINGQLYDAEMHFDFHYQNDTLKHLILALIFEKDDEILDYIFFEQLNIHNISDGETKRFEFLSLQNFFFGTTMKSHVLQYKGSFTRPPGSENVEWMIMRDPIKINSKQLDYLNNLWIKNSTFANGRGNNRKIQKMNNRKVKLYTKENTSQYHWIFVGGTIGFALILIISITIVGFITNHKHKVKGKHQARNINYSSYDEQLLNT